MDTNTLVRYAKFAFVIVLPSALMVFLFTKTNINVLVGIAIAIGLCMGLLFIFGLVSIPGTKEELEIMEEGEIISKVGVALNKLQKAGNECLSIELTASVTALVNTAKSFMIQLANDEENSVVIARSILGNVGELSHMINGSNAVVRSVDHPMYAQLKETADHITTAIKQMQEQYKEGRLDKVAATATTLRRVLKINGYQPPTKE